MSPLEFLILILGITAASVAASLVQRRARRRELAELALQWRMHYSPRDVFRLATSVTPRLPVPGAADVSVSDVIYGNEEEFHRFIFSIEYTIGVIRAKQRLVRVGTIRESKHRSDAAATVALDLADQNLPLLDQYRTLYEHHTQVRG